MSMLDELKWDDQGLIPAVLIDDETGAVLTLAYMNEESLEKTIETGETWLYSRSRQALWHKGETSGNTQKVVEIRTDCDKDALLVRVKPNGPACHTGAESCFFEVVKQDADLNMKASLQILSQLEALIKTREKERPENSYTTYLFEKGVDKILKKVGEETSEVIIAAKNRSKEELRYETADLLFHLFVLLQEQGLPFAEVLTELEKRMKPTASSVKEVNR